MGGISDEHVEWAVVNRLKAMLDEPPETKFNVTLAFALFSSILVWSKNRAWVAGNRGRRRSWQNPADSQAHGVREALGGTPITSKPWLLSTILPDVMLADRTERLSLEERKINLDFTNMKAEDFFKWLRDAIAHGDGRTIRPIHKRSQKTSETLLAGFQIVFAKQNGSEEKLTLSLYHDDIRRMGRSLAHIFCQELSGNRNYSKVETGTARIQEAPYAG